MLQRFFIIMLVCVGLAYLYDHSYVRTLNGPKNPWFIFAALMTILIFFNILRTGYNDTWNYREVYRVLVKPFPEAWEALSWELGENPLFNIMQSWLKTHNVDELLFLSFFGFWTVLIYVFFLKKHYTNFALTIFLFIAMGCYQFTMAAIKQCAATAICLIATDCALKKKWFPFILLTGIAALIHPYALMYLIVPFMMFRPWSRQGYFWLIALIAGGLLFQPMLGAIVDITTAIGEEYTAETFSRTGVSALRILVCWVPVVLSFVYRKELFQDSTREENFFVNMSMVYAGIMFMGAFGTALYFGRLSSYFSIMPVIALPWMISKIHRSDRRIIQPIAVICYLAYFYFKNTVEVDFETSYDALTLSHFFSNLVAFLKGGSV